MIEQGGECNGGLPTHHELIFKGKDDSRFLPTLSTFKDSIQNAHLQESGSGGCNPSYKLQVGLGFGATLSDNMFPASTADRINNIDCYVQGGALGTIGFNGAQTGSSDGYGVSLLSNMTTDNVYSGSFSYEVSFLKKDHTLILDLDKDSELFDGIGNQGLVIIPQDSDAQVAFNVEYYLAQAGIINSNNISINNLISPAPPGLST